MFTIAVYICHALAGIPEPVCTWEKAFQHLPMQACTFAQAGMAQWKETGKFAGDEYRIMKYRCVADTEVDLKGAL